MKKSILILIVCLLLASGCATSSQTLGDDYWSDFEYDPVTKRSYHKTPPVSARDMMMQTPSYRED